MTLKEFCDWWVSTVVTFGGPQALETAYKTAAVLAGDPKLQRAFEKGVFGWRAPHLPDCECVNCVAARDPSAPARVEVMR